MKKRYIDNPRSMGLSDAEEARHASLEYDYYVRGRV